jgi:hypothetical protein
MTTSSVTAATPRMMTATPTLAIALASLVAGCGNSDALSGDGDGRAPPDAPPSIRCDVSMTFNPPAPIASSSTTVRATAVGLDTPGVLTYTWHVDLNGTKIDFTAAQSDNSEIDFRAAAPGPYRVLLDVQGASVACPTIQRTLDVRPPGAVRERVRLRVVPPDGVAPPLELRRDIDGGADASFGIITVERGDAVTAMVRRPGGAAVPAYVRFSPASAPDAAVEAFSATSGMLATRVLAQPHSVLVIPSVPDLAPRRFTDWMPSPTALAHLDLAAGVDVSGAVRDPAGALLAGATVKLTIDGVPSTVATAVDGTFTLRVAPGVAVVVEVTPPSTSGLPRLMATSTALTLASGLAVRYAPGLVRRSLAGTTIQRQGAPVANAKLMVVGSLSDAGTVTAGAVAVARGDVRIAASAGGAGTLPATLVPAAALSAVITVESGDLAVAALDTTSEVPAVIDAPPMLAIAPILRGPGAAGLPGAVLELVPAGELAMAAAPVRHVSAGPTGAAATTLAAGGHYDLRLRDPLARAALLVVPDRVAATVEATYQLRRAVVITGTVMLGGTQSLANASVQILCDACNGIDRAKPIAEAVTDAAGTFRLAVPDPGTM